MAKTKDGRSWALGILAVLVLSQALNVVLGAASFQDSWENAAFADMETAAIAARRVVANALAFGRPPAKIPDAEEALDALRESEPGIVAAVIAYSDGTALYSSGVPESAPEALLPFDRMERKVVKEPGRYRIGLPVASSAMLAPGGSPDECAIWMEIALDAKAVDEAMAGTYAKGATNAAIVLPLAFVALVLVLWAFAGLVASPEPRAARIARRLRFAAIALVIVASQAGIAALNANVFRSAFVALAENSLASAARHASADFELVLERGMRTERIRNAELALDSRRIANPVVGRVDFELPDGRVLYAAGPDGPWTSMAGGVPPPVPNVTHSVAPVRLGDEDVAFVRAYASQEYIAAKLDEFWLDAFTLLVVALVITFELLGFITLATSGNDAASPELPRPLAIRASDERAFKAIRFSAFVFFFAAFFPLSFMPLFVESVVPRQALFGIDPSTWISLPFAIYLLGVTVLIPITAFVSNRRTLPGIYLFGATAFIAGTLAAAWSSDILVLALARFLAGCGYGAVITNTTTLVVTLTSKEGRVEGFGSWSAGIASATICAMPVGGIVVNRLGYRVGMIAAAALGLVAAIFLWSWARRTRDAAPAGEHAPYRFRFKDLALVFTSRRLVACLLFSSLPYLLADSGVFAYLFPLYMDSIALSKATIGRVMTLYGVIALCIPLIARYAGKHRSTKGFILLGNVLVGLSLLVFLLSEGIAAFAGVMIAMGFGLMLTDAVKEAYVCEGVEGERVGETRLLGIFEMTEKMLALGVPILAGALVFGFGYAKGVAAIGAFALLSVPAFALLAPGRKKAAAIAPPSETASDDSDADARDVTGG